LRQRKQGRSGRIEFALVHVGGDVVSLEMFAGAQAKLCKTVDVTELLRG